MQNQDACPTKPAAGPDTGTAAGNGHNQAKTGCICADPAFIAKLYPDVQRLLRKPAASAADGARE